MIINAIKFKYLKKIYFLSCFSKLLFKTFVNILLANSIKSMKHFLCNNLYVLVILYTIQDYHLCLCIIINYDYFVIYYLKYYFVNYYLKFNAAIFIEN